MLGTHDGYFSYTIGQRKGLNLSRPAADGRPRYVLGIEPASGTVTVGAAEDLDVGWVRADRVVFPSGPVPTRLGDAPDRDEWTIRGRLQVRAHATTTGVTAEYRNGVLSLDLDEQIRAVAPGQSAVLYDESDTIVLAAGTIVATRPAAPSHAGVVGARARVSRRVTTADPRPAQPDASVPNGMDAAADATPWRSGIATGLGSLPGTDPVEAAAMVAGELPDLPHLAELPDRGVGADMIGRSAALLVDISAEVVPSGWRLARRPGRDLQRARDLLAWDLDAAEQHYAGAGWVKLQVAGPWTLAAMIETPSGNRALTDHGAVSDLAVSLAEGVLAHRDEIRRRLPGTRVVVQVDEPALPAVLLGSLPTASGFGTVSPVDKIRAREVLGELVATRERPRRCPLLSP